MAAASRSMRRPLRASHTAKPEAVAPGDHLGRDHHQPREPGGHAQRRDDLRRDRRQRHLAQQRGALDAEVARDAEVDARDVRDGRAGREHDREERRHEDQEDRRRVADAEPEDRERDPGERRQAAEEVDERQERLRAPARAPEQQAGRHAQHRRPGRKPQRDAEERRDRVVDEAAARAARRRGRARPPSGCGKSDSGKTPADATTAHTATSSGGADEGEPGTARRGGRQGFPVNSMRRRDPSACALWGDDGLAAAEDLLLVGQDLRLVGGDGLLVGQNAVELLLVGQRSASGSRGSRPGSSGWPSGSRRWR